MARDWWTQVENGLFRAIPQSRWHSRLGMSFLIGFIYLLNISEFISSMQTTKLHNTSYRLYHCSSRWYSEHVLVVANVSSSEF